MENNIGCNKALWSLVSGASIQTEEGVLESELAKNLGALSAGCLTYKKNTKQSAEAFAKRTDISESWRGFVCQLTGVLGVEEATVWRLLCSYLASEFRGTSESLKELLKDQQQVRPLILDIWQFYRSERLYLLQIIKEILSSSLTEPDDDDASGETDVRHMLTAIKRQLFDQLRAAVQERPPAAAADGSGGGGGWSEQLGPVLGRTCRRSWIHFNLREVCELLQILLIYFYRESYQLADIDVISEIFQEMGYGSRLSYRTELEESNAALLNSIAHLSGSILVFMLDLPSLSTSVEGHIIWGCSENVARLERIISGLGSLAAHGPPLLAWTLSTYLARGAEGLAKAAHLGEIAIGNKVLKRLEESLTADYTSHAVVEDILFSQVYTMLSVLVAAFDPVAMGLGVEVENLTQLLLKHRAVATHFWSKGTEGGLGLFYHQMKRNFPRSFIPVAECLAALAAASPESCDLAVSDFSCLEDFTERLEDVEAGPAEVARAGVEGELILLGDRFPYPGTQTLCIPRRTTGEFLENSCVRWQVSYNGWQLLLAECGQLAAQLAAGGTVNAAAVTRVGLVARILAAVATSCPDRVAELDELTRQLFIIVHKFCLMSHPPLGLLANAMAAFASIALADKTGTKMMERLGSAGLLPRFSASASLLYQTEPALDPGMVGTLLAVDETVSGEYPLLIAFLHLLKPGARSPASRPGILFVVREVLPVASNWRYEKPGEREQILQLSLAAVLQYITAVPEGAEILASEQGLGKALLYIVSIGDRAVQTLLENQVSWERGRGTDLCSLVHLALEILHRLLVSSTATAMLRGPVGVAIRAPPSGPAPHLLLTLAHYAYFFHSPPLAVAAIRLLAAIAGLVGGGAATAIVEATVAAAPPLVSVLACLSAAAPAVKELLVARLESPLEDIRVKVAILELVAACVDQQPGMTQLLLGISAPGGAGADESNGTAARTGGKLEGEGCLEPVLYLLPLCREEKGDMWQALHLTILRLIHSLWDRSRLVATQYLREQPRFWQDLCWPLTDPIKAPVVRQLKLKAYVLRIMAQEIYTWKGAVAPDLIKVLEKICDEKSSCLSDWCDGELVAQEELEAVGRSDSTTLPHQSSAEEDSLFLLSSWRTFLLILSKDCPVVVSPAACRSTFQATTRRLLTSLEAEPPHTRLTILLAETGAVLIKRWQTKCADRMEIFCAEIALLMDKLSLKWGSLHPRARLALLSLGLSSLRVSQFKLLPEVGQEEDSLAAWLQPTIAILKLNFRDVEQLLVEKGAAGLGQEALQGPELALCLLHTLITRFPSEAVWQRELHRESTLQLLLSAAAACCSRRAAPSLILRMLRLLAVVAGTSSGSAALLLHELSRDVWLPLADLPDASQWVEVRLAGLELASTLLRVGRRHAVNNAITAAALMADRITADLVGPRTDLGRLGVAASVARFVAALAVYAATWRTEHEASLLLVYRASCRLLNFAAALLMRPSLLAAYVKVSRGTATEEDARRCRRVSAASDVEIEPVPAEAVSSHEQLLDIACSCLALLSALSPPLARLLAGDALLDPERWEPLLATSFSAPSLEGEEGEVPSYGTLLALANVALRGLTRDVAARSPSPGSRSCPSPARLTRINGADSPEKRRLNLILEKCLTVVLCQALLALSDPTASPREKQLMKRELGAELESITDIWRRYLYRGAAGGGGKSPGPPSRSAARSPAPPLTSTPARSRSPPGSAASPQLGGSSAGVRRSTPTATTATAAGAAGEEQQQFMRCVANLIASIFK